MNTSVHYKLMRLLEENPGMSQRDAARALGVSLGKVNYCLRALIGRGWVKAANFKNSQNKAAYLYVLTPSGLHGKAQLAVKYLKERVSEYEALRIEIEQMRRETRLDSEP
ncbi:MAG TPA: MarR family EPS-associated transcriptional regulator [Steroidobacteraceae bacterium]|nr:MarR family EPS-associated transcriptional regulator [Steroidobacteraceae bacterium]